MSPDRAVAPGGTLGVLGGGQLGRMLALAAARLGIRTHVYAPPGDAPAFQVAAATTEAAYDDAAALADFARACDVVTLEFENVPVAAVDAIARITPVRPGRKALKTAQDRLVEKRFLRSVGVETVPFFPVDDAADLAAALAETGGRGVLKTRRFGYDGKGQVRLSSPDDAASAIAAIGGAAAILEALADFSLELSAIVARGTDGSVAAFDAAENRHADGILRESRVPVAAPPNAADEAVDAARRIVDALDYVGVIGVEFFLTTDGRVLGNEFAPRVHNSGHWTEAACATSQFEQHVRAVCGWPLGDPARHSDARMENLLGDAALDWEARTPPPGASLHLYGKSEARPGRKMGHVTHLSPRSR